jgi:glucoamylase
MCCNDKYIGSKLTTFIPVEDGPPFRVDVLLKYAEWLIKPEQKNGSWVADNLWPNINLDLQWIATHWNMSS